MSHVIPWVRYPRPKSQWSMVIVGETELSNKSIYIYIYICIYIYVYILPLAARLCNNLGLFCFLRNKGKRCYKLEQLDYSKLGQVFLEIAQLLQIRATVITK